MRNQVRIILVMFTVGTLLWSCDKNDDSNNSLSLKEAVNQGTRDLNTAMDAIAASKAFSVFTLSDGTVKSGSVTDPIYKVYIPLDSIKGVFDYKPVPRIDRKGRSIIQFFDMTDDNDQMIVRMPLSKVLNPRALRSYSPADTLLPNNFQIAVSGYHNNYNNYRDFEYTLASAISVDDVMAGKLDIDWLVSPETGIRYASQYAITDSYTAKYAYESGDTTVSSFSINEGDKILYEERRQTVKIDTARFGREHQYILTIGDVQITRKSATRTVEVSVNGVLQPNATVTIVDKENDPEPSVCRKRDILITFEDGTTALVSELIGQSIGNIRLLFDSLHQVYFAAYVVDWIAYDIYYQRY